MKRRSVRWVNYLRRHLLPAERAMTAGLYAVRTRDWAGATAAFARADRIKSIRSELLVQWGHALKETGRGPEAIVVYRRAASLLPQDLDVRRHLTALLERLGYPREEVANLCREMLIIAPADREAMQTLARLGLRDRMPALPTENVIADQLCEVSHLRVALARAERALQCLEPVPLRFYEEFARRHPLPLPPGPVLISNSVPFHVVVVATHSHAAALEATLTGLAEQSRTAKQICVLCSNELAGHPVASLPGLDLFYARRVDDLFREENSDFTLLIPAGAILAPHAFEWFAYALDRTGVAVIYGDHDYLVEDWREGRRRYRPVLFSQHDPLAMAHLAETPLVALMPTATVRATLLDQGDPSDIIADHLALTATAIHLPRLLASRYVLPPPASAAPPDRAGASAQPAEDAIEHCSSNAAACVRCDVESIAVVIPTRDGAEMLIKMINSLVSFASRPEYLAFVVVDNRSTDLAIARMGDHADYAVTVATFDRPFNWSAANNLGASLSQTPILVFANNDMEMLTPGWDEVVREGLSNPDHGVVGARLLYPDGSYQHAGVLFGVDSLSLSNHEGVGWPGSAIGPDGRWITPRRVSAVTGAFMAMRRSSLIAVGGFNEDLAVAYNDLDLCLSMRSLELSVIYEPRLTLIHYESKTRGRNVTGHQVAWDEREQLKFVTRWGTAALRWDAAYNPQWARGGAPFDGLREPTNGEITTWIDLGAAGPWTPRR